MGQPAQCSSDLLSASTSLIKVGFRIANASLDCTPGPIYNQTRCLKDISVITTELGRVSGYVTDAVTDCGGPAPNPCTEAITAIVPIVMDASVHLTMAGLDCTARKEDACIQDITNVGTGIIQSSIYLLN